MSAELARITCFLSVALLAGLLPAQEKPQTVVELRRENAALRQQVKTLRAQLGGKIVRIVEGKFFKPAAGRLDLVLTPGTEVSYFRSSGFESYSKSLEALTQAKRRLDGARGFFTPFPVTS